MYVDLRQLFRFQPLEEYVVALVEGLSSWDLS